MALVKFGNGVSDIRGSIAGNVYSKNRYGSYIRNKVVPVNPQSSAQQAIRNIMAEIVSRWQAIVTQVQREAWEVYAASIEVTNKLGDSIKLTGFNHYVRSNTARRNIGFTPIDAGPTTLALPSADQAFAIVPSSAAQSIEVTFDDAAAWCSEDSAAMSLHQGIPQPGSRQFFDGRFRKFARLFGDSGSPITSPKTVAVDFPIAVGQKQWAKGRILRADGRLSEFFRDDAIIAS